MIPDLFKAVLVGVARKTTEERNAAMCLGDPNQRISITDTGLKANTDQKHTYLHWKNLIFEKKSGRK